MAGLDKILDSMGSSGAHTLTLKSGLPPQLHTATGVQAVVKTPLSEAHVIGYIKELADPANRAILDQRLPCTFPYKGFEVSVDFQQDSVSASIIPSQAPSAEHEPQRRDTEATQQKKAEAGQKVGNGNEIDPLFYEMMGMGASDLHLTTGEPPRIRLHGEMKPLSHPPLTPERIRDLLIPIWLDKNKREYEATHDTDFAYEIPGLARFRCNYFMDRTGMGAVFRQIPSKIPTVEQLALPKHVIDLCWLSKGFVVVTGPTGSGKSTTLAALVDYINVHRTDHIITIEDPIEFVHPNKSCLLNQREVGIHTDSFKKALRAALREDPDIVLVGEMRDLETIAIAIETAETGHLVFGTLHTTTAASTIDRIIDQFPADRQAQIRVMLSETIKGVIAQTLCKKIGGGRVAAFEILLVNSAISNLIREGKTFQIPSLMQTQKGIGNITLNDSLMELVKKGIVEPKEAYVKSVDKAGLKAMIERSGVKFDMEKDL